MSRLDYLYRSELSHRARSVFLYLDDHADKQRQCWHSIGTIAKELDYSPSTVRRALQDLRAAGFLETEQRWRDNGGKSTLLFTLIRKA